MRVSSPPRAVLALIGFTAIVAQIVLMRELMVVFCGNEVSLGIVLANWLLWTAFGSGVLGRLVGRVSDPRMLLAGLQGFIGVAFPITIYLVRAARNVFSSTPGEILGPGAMFFISLTVLSVFCSASGILFAAGSAAMVRHEGTTTVLASSSMYLWEAIGSAAGGLLASLVFIRYVNAFEIALIISLLNFVSASSVLRPRLLRRAAIGFLFVAFALLGFPILGRQLERSSQALLWRGFQLVETRDSIYGHLAVVKTEGASSLFQNGLVMFTAPDPAAAEESVHFALLQHPAPKRLLLMGGGVNGSLAQALQHSTLERVDFVELDPAIFDLARTYFPEQWAPVHIDPRVRLQAIDGRRFLKVTSETFDVIILNLPDPQTAQLNRYYTLEFFREVAARLKPNGVFSLQVRAAEDYISPELADFLRCIRKTLSMVFPEVTLIPGGTFHFFAAESPGVLAAGPGDLMARLRARHLQTSYVREYYIPFRMMPDRMLDADLQTRPRADTPVNRDFAPVAYYFDVALWSGRFSQGYRRLFQSLAGVSFGWVMSISGVVLLGISGTLGALSGKERRGRWSASFCVAATGFTLIGLEVLLLLGFQAIFGYVYHQLAILVAAFMVGMAAGSGWALHGSSDSSGRPERRGALTTLGWLQSLVAVSPLLLYAVLDELTRLHGAIGLFAASQVIFPMLALLSGFLGGYQFPVASRVFFTNTSAATNRVGTLYALDLVGACLGALVLSVYLAPVFGLFRTALLMAVMNLAPAGLAFLSIPRRRLRPG